MLDQSFSAENFRKIIDIENRKGIYLEGRFFHDVAALNNQIKDLNTELRLLRKKTLSKEDYLKERDRIEKEKEDLKDQKENLLKDKLAKLSIEVTSSKFKIELLQDDTIADKPVYKTINDLKNILTFKQLQYNFRKVYKVKQASRYSIVSHLKALLDDGFPKVILRTDIKEFYESVSQDKLLKKINDDNLLTHLSRKFITQILIEFNRLTGIKKGVPRGIGISAYLVELYLRDFDSRIKALSNVLYYARYVDDIIIVFMPQIDTVIRDYKAEVKAEIEKEELSMNEAIEKTRLIDLSNSAISDTYDIEYLGYRFASGYDSKRKHIPLTVRLSKRKKKRYAKRLINAFNLYKKDAIGNEKQARKIFIKRIRFLMGNTKLVNNKRNVSTGIYYANSLINNLDDLKHLDLFFNRKLFKSKFPFQLKKRLSYNNSFEQGFDPTRCSKYSITDLNKIMEGWKS